jgi:F-type H+-transporting ATPase subunit delta
VADDSLATDVGARYAQALFDLALETNALDTIEKDLKGLKSLIADSRDLKILIGSPRFNAETKAKGLAAVAERAGFSDTTRKFLGVVAGNGRASALSGMITAFEQKVAAHRGLVFARVTSAAPLTPAQAEGVAAALRLSLGKDPEIETHVDPALLGGLKVRVGSRLYDASLKSKLDSLKFALKRA